MINKKAIFRVSLLSVAAIAILLIGIVIFQSINNRDTYPDFNKPVYINSKYSNLSIDIKLSPDHTCEYSLSNDEYQYRGKWEITKEGKAIEINIALTHDILARDNKKIEGTILIYGSVKGKYLAAIPYDVMNMPGARVYGKWKQ